jgi:hypothetical protein
MQFIVQYTVNINADDINADDINADDIGILLFHIHGHSS